VSGKPVVDHARTISAYFSMRQSHIALGGRVRFNAENVENSHEFHGRQRVNRYQNTPIKVFSFNHVIIAIARSHSRWSKSKSKSDQEHSFVVAVDIIV
jgi:uncharacterized FAD-dependent dehydrogenase